MKGGISFDIYQLAILQNYFIKLIDSYFNNTDRFAIGINTRYKIKESYKLKKRQRELILSLSEISSLLNEDDFVETHIFKVHNILESVVMHKFTYQENRVFRLKSAFFNQYPIREHSLLNNLKWLGALEGIKHVLVHGSLGTLDFTEYSDADILIVLSNDVFKIPKKMIGIKKALLKGIKLVLKYDILQHHGFFLIPESFLQLYPLWYLPFETWEKMVTLGRDSVDLTLKGYKSVTNSRKAFSDMIYSLKSTIKKNKIYNLFQLKAICSQFMMLPTLYLQNKGIGVYKGNSFSKVKQELSDYWDPMDYVSLMREKWRRPENKIMEMLLWLCPNPWFASTIYRRLFCPRINNNVPGDKELLFNKMIQFIKQMEAKVNCELKGLKPNIH